MKSFVWVGSVGAQRYTMRNKGTEIIRKERETGKVRDIFYLHLDVFSHFKALGGKLLYN